MAELRELQDAFAVLERQAPQSCALPIKDERRRFVLPALAAAAVVVAAAAPILLLHKGKPAVSVPAAQNTVAPARLTPSHGDWTSRFTLQPPSGWRAATQTFWYDRQELDLTGPSTAYCSVSYYPSGRFATSRIASQRSPISIGGYSGWYAVVTDSRGDRYPSVALHYPHDAWLITSCRKGSADPQADAELLAGRVRLASSPLRLPFQIGWLPTGYTSSFATSNQNTLATAGFAPAGNQDASGLQVDVIAGRPNSTSGRSIDINGQPATLDGPVLTISRAGYTITLTASPTLSGGDDALIRTARGLRLASNPLDRTTWFDATTALP